MSKSKFIPSASGSETVSLHVVTPLLQLLKLAALSVEILIVAFVFAGNAWTIIAFGHASVVAILCAAIVLAELSKIDSSDLQKFALLTFAGGPIGAAAALIGEQALWRQRDAVLEDWYETLAPTERPAVTLVDKIIDGRLVRPEALLPRPFDHLLANGSMQEKQALLAYLAVEDDQVVTSDALKLALRSTDQRVRVQAAAVAAHARARARRRVAAQQVKASQSLLTGDIVNGMANSLPPPPIRETPMSPIRPMPR